jgi:protein-S-isoprenylcysteine O-methyltransferase Ste14
VSPTPARSAGVRPPAVTIALALAATALDAALLALALGGVPALIAHPRALALVAIWGASAIVLGLLRPVRAQDVTSRAAESRLLLLALFAIPLATPPVAAWAGRAGLWMLPGGAALGWIGVALAAVGLSIRIAAMARLGSRFAPTPAIQRGHALETGGLYAVSRHPGYAGSWLANAGAALAFGSAIGLAGVLLMSLALASRVRREEAMLEDRFGDEYRRYRARTGRWLAWPRGPRAS